MERLNKINITQDIREKLLIQIANFNENELSSLKSDNVPTKFHQNKMLLRNELLKALKGKLFISGWMFDFLIQFTVFRNEVNILAAYNCYDDESQTQHKAYNISMLLETNNPFLLLIDGNNLIHEKHDSPFYDSDFPSDLSWKQVATTLIEKTNIFLQLYPESFGNLYFDSPQFNQVSVSKQLRITESGGGDATDRADDAIIQDLNYYSYENSFLNRILITADKDLSRQAESLNVTTISPDIYFGLLKNLNSNNIT